MSNWIQHPITHELVPRDEYVRPKTITHAIHGDIQPFLSPIDRTVIGDRKQYREHCARHDVVPAQEFSPEYLAKRQAQREGEITSKAAQQDRKKIMYEAWTAQERQHG